MTLFHVQLSQWSGVQEVCTGIYPYTLPCQGWFVKPGCFWKCEVIFSAPKMLANALPCLALLLVLINKKQFPNNEIHVHVKLYLFRMCVCVCILHVCWGLGRGGGGGGGTLLYVNSMLNVLFAVLQIFCLMLSFLKIRSKWQFCVLKTFFASSNLRNPEV